MQKTRKPFLSIVLPIVISSVFLLALLSCERTAMNKELSGLFHIKQNGKVGFIDKTGRIVINPQFDMVGGGGFGEGLAQVKIGGKWGFIDKTGKMVINPQFDGVSGGFKEGLAQVKIGDRWGYIDRTGKYVWNPTK